MEMEAAVLLVRGKKFFLYVCMGLYVYRVFTLTGVHVMLAGVNCCDYLWYVDVIPCNGLI